MKTNAVAVSIQAVSVELMPEKLLFEAGTEGNKKHNAISSMRKTKGILDRVFAIF
jgi:hypothetical protein